MITSIEFLIPTQPIICEPPLMCASGSFHTWGVSLSGREVSLGFVDTFYLWPLAGAICLKRISGKLAARIFRLKRSTFQFFCGVELSLLTNALYNNCLQKLSPLYWWEEGAVDPALMGNSGYWSIYVEPPQALWSHLIWSNYVEQGSWEGLLKEMVNEYCLCEKGWLEGPTFVIKCYFKQKCTLAALPALGKPRVSHYLADPGEASGCSTNTFVINWLIN